MASETRFLRVLLSIAAVSLIIGPGLALAFWDGAFAAPAAPARPPLPESAPCLAGISPPGPADPQLSSVTFPPGSIVIPMDMRQTDVVRAFGFVHALLRNSTVINRIIEPLPVPPEPSGNISIKTNAYPSGTTFFGGPMLIQPNYTSTVTAVHAAFPGVSYQTTTELFTCNYVFIVKKPTKILVIWGMYGHTTDLLTDMGIPFDTVNELFSPNTIQKNPRMVDNYSLIVDDCPGQGLGLNLSAEIAVRENLTRFVSNGNELIFTDQSLDYDFRSFPWGSKMNVSDGDIAQDRVITCDFHCIPDFPGQYYGKANPKIWQMYDSRLGCLPVDPDVKIIADTTTYPIAPAYRILACYFYWGEKQGVVEFFAYHPFEQTVDKTGDSDSYKLASFLYGNKFLHVSPIDWGVTTQNSASPKTIAQKGTGSPPSLEETTLTISVRAMGNDIVYDNQMKVNYELNPWISCINGTFRDQYGGVRDPGINKANPNGSTTLRWIVSSLNNKQYWNVSFKITSTKLGDTVYVNAAGRSNVTFVDGDGKNRTQMLVVTYVRVTVGGVPEIWLITAAPLAAAIAAGAIWRRQRKEQ